MLVIIFGAGTAQDEYTGGTIITLQFNELVIMMVWLGISLIVLSMLKDSPWMRMGMWVLVYLPLLVMTAAVVFKDEAAQANPDVLQWWRYDRSAWWVILMIMQIIVVFVFWTYYYLYPRVIVSEWMRKRLQTTTWPWRIRLVSKWTMTFATQKYPKPLGFLPWKKRYTCKYQGTAILLVRYI